MSDLNELDSHPASRQEQLQAYENVFPVWPHGKTLEKHVANRLESVQHNRARWFVGCLDDRVVVSLGCYPMKFFVHDQPVEGIAIGAVHTVPEFRRRGLAARLIDQVEKHCASEGCELSLLFSDIPVDYYARLGYVACPALEGWIPVEQSQSSNSFPLELVEFDPIAELDDLRTVYASHHQRLAVSIDRDKDYWNHLIQKWPSNRFYWVVDSSNAIRGYVRLAAVNSRWKLTDFAVGDELVADLVPAILKKARAEGQQIIGGWLPGSPAFAGIFPLTPRTMEMTMFKFLNPEKQFDLEMQHAAGCIHEIDHV